MSNILSVTSSFCTISTALYAKIKRSKIGAMCKKKRCYANLEASLKRRGLLLPWGQPCLRRRDIRDLRDLKDKRGVADTGLVLDVIRGGMMG